MQRYKSSNWSTDGLYFRRGSLCNIISTALLIAFSIALFGEPPLKFSTSYLTDAVQSLATLSYRSNGSFVMVLILFPPWSLSVVQQCREDEWKITGILDRNEQKPQFLKHILCSTHSLQENFLSKKRDFGKNRTFGG